MKDYMKFKITRIVYKFSVKVTKAEKILWQLSKEGKAFSHVHTFISMFQKNLVSRVSVYQDLTLC